MTLTPRSFLLLSLLCSAAAGAVFLRGLPGGFVLDDFYNITQNTGIQLQSLSPAALLNAAFSMQMGGSTRVLPTLTFALDYFRAGGTLDPATFKTTNIFIHAVTTLVLAWFLRSLLTTAGTRANTARWVALTMAFVWAVHPLQVSSVLYVVQRMQTMATLFIVLALWSYLTARRAQMESRGGRSGWMLTGLLWALALACKEDAVLLPAYTLAMELTVLRFQAGSPALAHRIKRGYLVATVAGVGLFLFVVIPHYWSWDAYSSRNFSSLERLLTQGRVLCLYLWQILVPLPSHMPFYYDWLQPSRGLLRPWITLPALLLIGALLVTAWKVRHRRPLFAVGIFLFFAGHFVTSNVVGLELAFEHRNHLPMIGIVLAAGDLLMVALGRFHLRATPIAVSGLMLLAGLSSATALRATSWNSELSLAQTSTRLVPNSGRAWNSLCVIRFEQGGGMTPGNPNLDQAIADCTRAADASADSVKPLSNIIAFRSLSGDVTNADWSRLEERLEHATMTPDNAAAVWVILNRVRDGARLDTGRILQAIETINRRTTVKPIESAAFGYFILGNTSQPDKAYAYFARAVRTTTDPAFAASLADDLRKEGHPDWADRLMAARRDAERQAHPLP